MGNCLDIPPPPPKKRHLYKANSSYAPGSSVSSISAWVHGSKPRLSPYTSQETLVTADHLTGQPFIYSRRFSAMTSSRYQPGHANIYLPFHSSHPSLYPYGFDDHWSDGRYLDNFVSSSNHRHRSRYISRNGDQKGNMSKKKRNSTIITTFPNPRDDLIKRGSQIIVTSRSVIENADTTIVSGHIGIPSPSSKDEVPPTSQKTFESLVAPETKSKRGSTYITYIEDHPNPKYTEKVPESKVDGETPGFAETGDADGDVIKLLVDEPVTSSSSTGHVHGQLVTSEFSHSQSSPFRPVDTPGPLEPVDVVICYGSSNGSSEDISKKIEGALDSEGLRVTTAKSGPGISEQESTAAANAILQAKVVVVLLSSESIKHRASLDQVSLAHVCGAALYPVTLGSSLDIITNMEMALKLQLGSYKWTDLSSSAYLDMRLYQVVRSVLDEMEVVRGSEVIDEDYGEVRSRAQRHYKVTKQRQVIRSIDLGEHVSAGHYWDKHYGSVDAVAWDRFLRDLAREYHELLNCSVPKQCMPQLKEVLKLEMGADQDGHVRQEQFLDFCRDLGTDRDVWEKVHSVAKETSAVRNIFSGDSTISVVAINNIVRFVRPSIITTLKKLLSDEDSDIRAAATVALSQCPLPGDDHIVEDLQAALDDPIALVREAGCLAMVHLQNKDAMEKLSYMKIHDADTRVRETAGTAISQLNTWSSNTLRTQRYNDTNDSMPL